MYRNLQQLPQVGRRLGKTKVNAVTRSGMPVGLSGNLTQRLHKSFYVGLYQGVGYVQPTFIHHPTSPVQDPDFIKASSSVPFLSGVTVRQVSLLPEESISYIFTSEKGLITEPSSEGRMLVLTNQRIITFGQKDGVRETVLVPLEGVKAVSVKVGKRSRGTLFQGGMMIVAAVFFYVLLAYWLTGRIDGPTVPIIRMDLVAFSVFLAILIGVALLAQIYFAKPDGEVIFQGEGIKLTFPFRGKVAEGEMNVLINAAFVARHAVTGGNESSVD